MGQVKKVIGDFKLCVKMAQFDAKKFAEVGKAAGGDKKGKKEDKKPKEEKKNLNLSNKRTHLRAIQRVILIWKISSDSTPITMKISLFHTSGKNLTKKTIPFGDAITNTLMN